MPPVKLTINVSKSVTVCVFQVFEDNLLAVSQPFFFYMCIGLGKKHWEILLEITERITEHIHASHTQGRAAPEGPEERQSQHLLCASDFRQRQNGHRSAGRCSERSQLLYLLDWVSSFYPFLSSVPHGPTGLRNVMMTITNYNLSEVGRAGLSVSHVKQLRSSLSNFSELIAFLSTELTSVLLKQKSH